MRKGISYIIFAVAFFSCIASNAATSIDSVYKIAYIKTEKKSYSKINLDKKGDYPLQSKFISQKSDLVGKQLAPYSKEITASVALSNNYNSFLEESLKKAGLPASYKYIPVVLSGMVNTYKDEHGRTGIWQLPYPIAVKEGLIVNTIFDERLDYKKATKAAIQHLGDLISLFQDSTLALTAYFNGIGATRHALDQAKNKDVESVYNLLPVATRDYLFVWNHLSGVLSHSRNNFKERHTVESMGALERVEVTQATHLMAVAKVVDIPSSTLKAINPTLVGMMIPSNNYLRLPLGKKSTFMERTDSIYKYQKDVVLKPKVYKPPKPKYTPPPKGSKKNYYTVRSGDNLGSIASKHHVYVSQLKSWNGLNSDRIYAGQKLVVWSKEKTNATTKPKTTKTVSSSEGKFIIYTVKSGDSLWGISQKYPGVSADDIQKWNGIGENIDVGQELKIKVQ